MACNGSSEIVEINAESVDSSCDVFPRVPAFTTSKLTHDGQRLIATNKRDQSVSIYEVKSGRELARVPTKRKVLHGVVVSPDDRYAFVTVEGIGSEPGTVEIIDLATLKTVATIDLPPARPASILQNESVKICGPNEPAQSSIPCQSSHRASRSTDPS